MGVIGVRVVVGAAALLVVGALSGCAASSVDSAGRSTSATPSAPIRTAPAPTATSTGVAIDPADARTWIISADGVGPIRVDLARDTAISAAAPAMQVIESADACPNPAVSFLGPAGATTADASITLSSREDGSVVAIAVSSAGPRSAEGIGVGATVGQVLAAYPSAVHGERYGDPILIVKGDPGWISYESSTEDASAMITLISVVAGGTPPAEYCG